MQMEVNVNDIVKQYQGKSSILKKTNEIEIDHSCFSLVKVGNPYKVVQLFQIFKKSKVKQVNVKYSDNQLIINKDNFQAVFYCVGSK